LVDVRSRDGIRHGKLSIEQFLVFLNKEIPSNINL
jgi:hypothetical protein